MDKVASAVFQVVEYMTHAFFFTPLSMCVWHNLLGLDLRVHYFTDFLFSYACISLFSMPVIPLAA